MSNAQAADCPLEDVVLDTTRPLAESLAALEARLPRRPRDTSARARA